MRYGPVVAVVLACAAASGMVYAAVTTYRAGLAPVNSVEPRVSPEPATLAPAPTTDGERAAVVPHPRRSPEASPTAVPSPVGSGSQQ
ncbi:MAG TPA: hypothetical protein VLC50_04720 [Actinomycetes bacterium]|nr:hypothetical protein [Actinomycetes bacterium]